MTTMRSTFSTLGAALGSSIGSLLVAVCVCSWPGLALAAEIDAAHHVVVEAESLHVKSQWYDHERSREQLFAAPLPAGTTVVGRGVTPTLDRQSQALLGVRFEQMPPYPLVLELEIPYLGDEGVIPLPVPAEPGWQRLEVEGDYRLIPDVGAALPLHSTGYYAPSTFHLADRVRVDRHLDGRHPAGAAYLPGAMLGEAGGMVGQLESGAARKSGLGIAAGGVFLVALVALGIVFRRQANVVDVEEAEAYLDAELNELCDHGEEERA